MMSKELTNSEILLIYEAKLCNPNGDPDAENRPRIDPKTEVNIVTDVRLKRFFRDYIADKYGEDCVYVTKLGGKSVRADTRVARLINKKEDEVTEEDCERVLELIDARLFGATVPLRGKKQGTRGASISFIGPLQFTWGYSFHRVELVESSTITSVFAGREEAERYGTMGKDWRVYYSLIGFYGVVSGRRAKYTGMTETDLKIFDNLIWTALQVQPTTRSKIGERPHLYLRVEYKDADTILGDLRKFITVSPKDKDVAIRDFKDLKIEFDKLLEHLDRNRAAISRIYVRTSDELEYLKSSIRDRFPDLFAELPHKMSEQEIEAIIKRKGGRSEHRVTGI